MVQFYAGLRRTCASVTAPLRVILAHHHLSASQLIARAYIAAIMTLALVAALDGLASWRSDHVIRFVLCLLVAIVTSGRQLRIPPMKGTVSVNSLLILAGIALLPLSQALAVGWCCVLAQYPWRKRLHGQQVRLLFNASSATVAITISYRLFHLASWAPYIQFPMRLALVTCCYFATNTLSDAITVCLIERKTLTKAWQECYIASLPSYFVGAGLVGIFNLATIALGWQIVILAIPAIYLVYPSYCSYMRRLGSEKAHAEQMASLHLRTIEALALAIEAKDHTTHDHLRRVQVYAMEMGKELNLSEVELEALRAAALLHDIGKLAVPEHIISKPGKLTTEEFEKMKIHPIIGAEILERVEFPYPVVPIVAAHHEQWDGSGYPYGLRQEQIPIGARILAAVDCLDALASDRQYRRAIPLNEAMEVVTSESGKAFDPRVVSVLKRRYVELEQMAKGQRATKLSTDYKVERGLAPAAGLERMSSEMTNGPETKPIEFLNSIAAARQEAQTLFEMAQDLGNSLSLNETLSVMAVRMKTIIPYDGLAIYLKEDRKLKPAFVTGDDFRLFSSLEIPLGDGLSGWVAENRKAIINGNPSVEPGYLNDPSRYSKLRSALAVPLEGIDGLVGVMALYHAEKDAFKRDHLRILLAITSKLALTIENNLKYRMVKDSATTDYLTGLPNARSLFMHLEGEVSRCLRTETSLTVLACDLDGFKLVNDRFGHLEGNRILRAVADAMRSICREYDYVARMGGDEFVIILPGVPEPIIETMIERFCEMTRDIGYAVRGEDILALSVGRAVLPQDGCEAEKLLAKADMRMYKVKRETKEASVPAESTLSLSKALEKRTAQVRGFKRHSDLVYETDELASRPHIAPSSIDWLPENVSIQPAIMSDKTS